MLTTPVALVIFNRPETTARVFARIAEAQPTRLLIVADGPRPGKPADIAGCAAAREVTENITWSCDVTRNYADVNLGCGLRPATGISWVFDQVEKAIILEDDCVPHPSFFPYCEELLDRYRDDERIMQICGNNFQSGATHGPHSYMFSHHNLCWGWASWRRAWKHFDMTLALWPELRPTGWLASIAEHPVAVSYWQRVFDQAHATRGQIDYWDYQWTFACWAQNGLSIIPRHPLIENVGFGAHATHTLSADDSRAEIRAEPMLFPLTHPPCVTRCIEADRLIIADVVRSQTPPPAPPWHRNLIRRAVAKGLRTMGMGRVVP